MKKNTKRIFSFMSKSVTVLVVILIFSTLYSFWDARQKLGDYQQSTTLTAESHALFQDIVKIENTGYVLGLLSLLGLILLITVSRRESAFSVRALVLNIGKTAQNASLAALDAQKITKELAVSSGNQAQEIVEVTASVNAMANSIEQVSANASESATVALESVNIAGEGGKVVRSTISGMERIQTQIQETSNYMRRLSDSSQEIGEIVSLIDGIADQTNILSLNAAIQAAMAGEAGRGFAVVADEVQRLAEKVSYATKEIGSLVRSIQTDTSQVIGAMEQTKTQVLEGVNFAQDAGSTLEKIETVSRRLSDLIQNISLSAGTQATVSAKISHMMNDVKDIAQQTALGTMTTVDLIGKLLQYVTDLGSSLDY